MSHKTNVFSAPGTPVEQRTVGELVAERPGRSRIFQQHQIDFCCQGGLKLQDACTRKGVAVQTIVTQLEAEAAQKTDGKNPATLPLHELTSYIVNKHHEFLKTELPRLSHMSARVATVHGGHTQSLIELANVYQGLNEELSSHILKEEQILFPAIEALSTGRTKEFPLDGPIGCMIREHDDAGSALKRLRELSHGFVPPPEACNTYRALFAGLADLEKDLHTHIHLENAVLFPGAQALVAANN
ncbi:MAG: ytfE [Verrucomicrobiales bacterium]|nr:ytfE [Verrucomicrobiales bacterium]